MKVPSISAHISSRVGSSGVGELTVLEASSISREHYMWVGLLNSWSDVRD